MPFQTPPFWFEEKSWQATCLKPLSTLYRLGDRLNQKTNTPYKSNIPLICVGNIVSGGAGKTPCVQALLILLKDNDLTQNPVILLRGYGGKLRDAHLVDLRTDSFTDVGDEALLHVQHAPTIISKNRADGARLAEAKQHDLILMDDGLQNYQLQKDISFLVFDTDQGLGNGQVIPAGPLRESLESGLEKTDAIIKIGNSSLPFATRKPVFNAAIKPDTHVKFDKPVIAFAGIGRPQKFFDSLKSIGADIKAMHIFADHHAYTDQDLENLINKAKEFECDLITTEKDFVRIPKTYQKHIKTLPVSAHFEDPKGLLDFLKAQLHS